MNKLILLVLLAVATLYGGYRFFESPESFLKKKTQKLVKLSSFEGIKTDMGMIARVSKIVKSIHFDVQLKAEYKGQIYKARSLNEFRSLMLLYFRDSSGEKLEYKKLNVKMIEPKTQAQVFLDVVFDRKQHKVACEVILDWFHEEKWYIKKIEIKNCK